MTYIRDKKTNTVINNDIGQYKNILALRRKQKENRSLMGQIDVLKNEVKIMRTEVDTIKQFLGINTNE